MIPYRDNIRSNSTPIIVYGIILSNVLVFFYELALSDFALDSLIHTFGVIPYDFLQGLYAKPFNWHLYIPLVTNLFLHADWMHIIGNMWYLKIFGENVEDRLGHVSFVFFYFFCGIGADLAQIIIDPTCKIPSIGASGAISGVLGAYFVCFPWAKVSIIMPSLYTVIDIPALIFLGFWFLLQLLSGAASLRSIGSDIAWWAHICGFLVGMILIIFLPRASIKGNLRDQESI